MATTFPILQVQDPSDTTELSAAEMCHGLFVDRASQKSVVDYCESCTALSTKGRSNFATLLGKSLSPIQDIDHA